MGHNTYSYPVGSIEPFLIINSMKKNLVDFEKVSVRLLNSVARLFDLFNVRSTTTSFPLKMSLFDKVRNTFIAFPFYFV